VTPETARPASQPVHDVEVRWDVRIPVRDGLELSANLWLPVPGDGGTSSRFPAILEMIPYGKDNWHRNADVAHGEWLAARGFAFCRLDVRGTGSSPGIALDEYTEAETLDGYDTVEWLAAQAWCNGNVGMWGISYGGFTSIQVAKLRPPHLRAILPMYATDDRYRDDVHVRGGCLTASEKSQYAVSQLGMNAMPPLPSFRGEGWRDEWLERLEHTPPWLFPWIREQTDGPYWRRGSLAPDYDALECAVFQVAGWSDSYVDPAFRIQERCTNAVRRTLVGNWVHSYPDDAYPGPNLDWWHEAVRFFDRYLHGVQNGWETEPALTWFEREWAEPEPFPKAWPGRWRAADAFPVTGTVPLELDLDEETWSGERILRPGLRGDPDGEPASAHSASVAHRATVGTSGGLSWGAGWPPNGLARELGPDERRGITFTTEPLGQPLSIIGRPEVVLFAQATMPVATCVVRLSEVSPDGVSSLVATGVLNLTHRASDAEPSPMPATKRPEEVRIPLRSSGYRFAAGNRIRLTVLTSYWPALWPSPLPGELRLFFGRATTRSRLVLPVLPAIVPTRAAPAFKTSPSGMREVGSSESDPPVWRIAEDVIAGTVVVTIEDGGATIAEDGSRLYSAERLVLTASDADPAHASLASDVVYRWTVEGYEVDIRAAGGIASDAEAFDVHVDLDVCLDGEPVFAREWRERIPRRLV
jgi:putative CocE/NonD family hydrolase